MRRALLVEDDITMASLMSLWLEPPDWSVTRATTAASARAAMEKERFDVVLLDFQLPDGDGVEVLREWRAAGNELPIVALTGATSESVVEALLRAGAHDVVDKAGLMRPTLLAAIDGAVGPPPMQASPRPRALDDEAAASDEARVDLAPGRALVVDDVGTTRLHVRAILERAGWRVDESESAEDALRQALAVKYDALVVDHLLPDIDGVGLVHEMRRAGVAAPIVALTAHGDERLAREFLDQGVAAFLPKERLTRDRLLDAIAIARLARADVRLR